MIPTTSPQDAETEDLVHRLRDDVVPEALGGSGITAEIGGVTAALEDQSEYITDRMPLFIAGVVGLSFLLLLVAFHSPLISLKAAVMNLLSVGAAYGVMTVVAKGGTVGELIGIDHEVPIAPFMPVMMFAILFGLSMDYEVFLISRIREEYLKDGDTRRAVADGLAKTARVITAAAAIMVVVFLAFLAAPDVFLKLFGIGLAVGDLPRRDARADGARARRDAAARQPQLVDPELARADPAAPGRRARRSRPRGGTGLTPQSFGCHRAASAPPGAASTLRQPAGPSRGSSSTAAPRRRPRSVASAMSATSTEGSHAGRSTMPPSSTAQWCPAANHPASSGPGTQPKASDLPQLRWPRRASLGATSR